MDTSGVGAITEFAVASALSNAGLFVYLPLFNSHSRIDLIYTAGGGDVRRVQCKTAHLRDGAVTFNTCSNTGGIRRTYDGDADEFGVYCIETGAVYLVPVGDVPTRLATLRLLPTKSNQARGIRWAEPYLFSPQ